MREIVGLLKDIGNHDDRVVKHDEPNGAVVDTARVSDGAQPYETGVLSPHYDGGEWVIVEAYDTMPGAILGHDRWVAVFSREYAELPEELRDCQNAGLAELFESEDLCYLKQ